MESGKNQQQPIIIVKKKGRHGGHHGGAWKVAYADFVTAMMAFFLVMWIVNQGEAVKAGIGGYFRDPVGFTERAGEGVLQGGKGVLDAEKPARDDETMRRERETHQTLEQAGREIMRELQQVAGFNEMADRIEVQMADGGLRIQMMESGDSTFFDLGSAEFSPSGRAVLSTIGESIATLDYKVIVEGHTDSRAFSNTNAYSNWELASDRANSARRLLEEHGVSPERFVEIRSFADKKLRFPGRPEDPRNRRIGIIVLNPYANSESPADADEADGRIARHGSP